MKKLFAIIIALLVCLTGCSTNSKLSSSTMPDYQHMFRDKMGFTSTQRSDNGYYNLLGSYIIYTDKSTMKSTPLCDKPDCLHQGELDCKARLLDRERSKTDIQIYHDRIYYLAMDESGNSEQMNWIYLKSLPLDGGSRQQELVFKDYSFVDWFIDDGYFYCVVLEIDKRTAIRRINLETKEETDVVKFSDYPDIYGIDADLLNVYDGYAYMNVTGFSNEESYKYVLEGGQLDNDLSHRRDIVRYDLTDGSYTAIEPYEDEEYYFAGFSDGKLVGEVCKKDSSESYVCISDLDGKNPRKVLKKNAGNPFFCDDEYFYELTSFENHKNIELITYDKSGKKLSAVTVPDDIVVDVDSAAFGDDYIWIQPNDFAMGTLATIDKKDLLKDGEELSYEEVYVQE